MDNVIAQTLNVLGNALANVDDGCLLGPCTGSALIDHLSLSQTILS